MKAQIRQAAHTIKRKFKDESGYFEKLLALKDLERYANEIDSVLTRFNKKSCNETMMVKGPRKSCAETTNRKTHTEDLEKIVVQLAKGLGLNEQVVRIMGKHHDIGHTFLGHSGEWWISNILEDMEMGPFCHNTLGARQLIYTDNVYDEIIRKIRVHNPKISEKKLAKIKKSLWLIMDAINAHNGETPDKEFIPKSNKTEKDFTDELLACYSIRGYDRKIMPATPEGCLMRLADKIAYTPLDMVDGIQEKMIRDQDGRVIDYIDEEYTNILKNFGIEDREISRANNKKDFSMIAEKIKEAMINDVIANSSSHRIKMSDEMTLAMGSLLTLNNKKAVDNVILVEDQMTYPRAVRTLIEDFGGFILDNDLLFRMKFACADNEFNQKLTAQTEDRSYDGFIQYLGMLNPDDYYFTREIVEQGTRRAIEDELKIAKDCVEKRQPYECKEELGLDYSHKNGRIKEYVAYYEGRLRKGQMVGYSDEDLKSDTEKILSALKQGKKSENHMSFEERVAKMFAAQYIATLNDPEFLDLLLQKEIIDEEKRKSLTRKYKDIKDLKSEVYVQSNWKEVSSLQASAVKGNEQGAKIK